MAEIKKEEVVELLVNCRKQLCEIEVLREECSKEFRVKYPSNIVHINTDDKNFNNRLASLNKSYFYYANLIKKFEEVIDLFKSLENIKIKHPKSYNDKTTIEGIRFYVLDEALEELGEYIIEEIQNNPGEVKHVQKV